MARLESVRIIRGDLWIVDLRPTTGHEASKRRPAIIVSNNQINNISPLVIIIPISSKLPKTLGPERILFLKKDSHLEKDSVILVNQVRAVDKSRLVKRVGKIPEEKLEEVEDSLKLVLGMIEFDN